MVLGGGHRDRQELGFGVGDDDHRLKRCWPKSGAAAYPVAAACRRQAQEQVGHQWQGHLRGQADLIPGPLLQLPGPSPATLNLAPSSGRQLGEEERTRLEVGHSSLYQYQLCPALGDNTTHPTGLLA